MSEPHNVSLSRFRHSDIETLVGWIGSEKALIEWAGPSFNYPFCASDFRQHLKTQTGARFHPLSIVDEKTDMLLAYGEVNVAKGADPVAADLSRIIVAPGKSRGKGIGVSFVSLLIRFCFDDLGLTRVGLNVYTHNQAAVLCYRRAGFQEDGRIRSVVRCNGAFWDSYVMSALKDEL